MKAVGAEENGKNRELPPAGLSSQQSLEEQVRQRTAELCSANSALENKTIALREVLKDVHAERDELVQSLRGKMDRTVTPLVEQLRQQVAAELRPIVQQLQQRLAELLTGQADPLAPLAFSLTPAELNVCRWIRQGRSSKEIARQEGISVDTVDTHRKNIRRKLKIVREGVNLTSYLQSLDKLL